MSNLIQKWTEELITGWGLKGFKLTSSSIKRGVTSVQTTEYKLDMEWFPPGVEMEEDLNPPGTITAEVNLTYDLLTRFSVRSSEDYRVDPPVFSVVDLMNIVSWIESHTRLKHKADFQFVRKSLEDDCTEYFFSSILHNSLISPGGYIEVKVNGNGCIVYYSLFGFFSALFPAIPVELVHEKKIQRLEEIKEKQVVLFGTMEETGYRLLYGVIEVFFDDEKILNNDEISLHWNVKDPIQEVPRSDSPIFEQWQAFHESQTITETEMEEYSPHPDSLLITADEKSELLQVITNYMRKHRPNESGKWQVENIDRQNGHIHADVKPVRLVDRIFDKFKFVYDAKKHVVVQVMDKREWFSGMMELPSLDTVKISKEEAMVILDKDIYFKPYYVYDSDQKVMKSMLMIDCHTFVDAVTGEVVLE